MKALKIILGSACLTFLLSLPAMAQGFGWKGKTADEMELTFDEKVVKRDSPENLLKSFFEVQLGIRTRSSVFIRMQELQFESESRWLEAIITKAAHKQKFGPSLKSLKFFRKHPPVFKLDMNKSEISGSETIVHFTASFESSKPCRKCNTEADVNGADKDCKPCKGSGVQTRKQDSKNRATVHSLEGKLFIKALEIGCYTCKGAKACIHCRNNDGNKQCFSCTGTKLCQSCRGQGFTPDRTLRRGPNIITNLPKKVKLEASPDLSNPKSTFSLFTDALIQSKRIQSALENRCVKAYRKFLKSFLGGDIEQQKDRKFRAINYTLVKKVKIDENTLKFHYNAQLEASSGPKSHRNQMASAPYVLILVKVKDQWKINSFLEKCWNCNATGIDYNKASCKECKGKKYKPSTRLP